MPQLLRLLTLEMLSEFANNLAFPPKSLFVFTELHAENLKNEDGVDSGILGMELIVTRFDFTSNFCFSRSLLNYKICYKVLYAPCAGSSVMFLNLCLINGITSILHLCKPLVS